MGNCCKKKKEKVILKTSSFPKINQTDRDLIIELWYYLNSKEKYKENGQIFFIKLFIKYPNLRGFFHECTTQSKEELRCNVFLRAHGIAVFSNLSLYIDSLDDPETLRTLIKKRAITHSNRGISPSDMEKLKEVMLEFMKDKSAGKRHLSKNIAAWERFLTIHNAVYSDIFNKLLKKELPTLEDSKFESHEIHS